MNLMRVMTRLGLRRVDSRSQGYESLREGRHVFIFGIWGRTSTTALQRILNSTEGICIWGEPGNFLVDNLVEAHHHILKRIDTDPKSRLQSVPDAFRRGDFSQETAMARADWRSGLAQVRQAFLDMFAPVVPVNRLGFKEIQVRSPLTYLGLKEMFPKCEFVFLFRDPVSQWTSVQTRIWPEARSIELFASRVESLAAWSLEQAGTFLDAASLRDKAVMDRLVAHLGLPRYKAELLADGVFAARNKPIVTAEEKEFLSARLGGLHAQLKSRQL